MPSNLMESFQLIHSILRDYQKRCVDEVIEKLDKNHSPLLQIPTGGGKSICMITVILDRLLKGESVGIVIHKEELLRQWHGNFSRFLPEDFNISICGEKSKHGKKYNKEARLHICTVQTLLNRIKDGSAPELNLLVFDETHHIAAVSWSMVLKHYQDKGCKLHGATATPRRTDNKGLDYIKFKHPETKELISLKAYTHLISGPQGKELIEAGFLVPTEIKKARLCVCTDDLEVDKNGEFKIEKATRKMMDKIKVEEVWRQWEESAYGKSTIAYPVSVEYSIQLADYFNDQQPGIASHIDADTPEAVRVEVLDAFERGEILVLFQHSIVIEGVDIPRVDCVLSLRPTASLGSWLQILGRGLRPYQGKDKLLLIDFTENHSNLPLPEDIIIWGLDGDVEIRSRQYCPECEKERRCITLSENPIEKVFKCCKCENVFSIKAEESYSGNGIENDNGGGGMRDEYFEELAVAEAILVGNREARKYVFKSKPSFYDFEEAYEISQSAEGSEEELFEFVRGLAKYREDKGCKPFWGVFEMLKFYEGVEDKPSPAILLAISEVFMNKENPTPHDKLQFNPNPPSDRVWRKAMNSWRWAKERLAEQSMAG